MTNTFVIFISLQVGTPLSVLVLTVLSFYFYVKSVMFIIFNMSALYTKLAVQEFNWNTRVIYIFFSVYYHKLILMKPKAISISVINFFS